MTGRAEHGTSDPASLLAGVRRTAMALPGTTEGVTKNAPTWFAGRSSFAKFVDPAEHRFDESSVALWAAAPDGVQQEVVSTDPATYFVPPFGGHGWIGMRLDLDSGKPSWSEIAEVLAEAHRQVAPKRDVARLDTALERSDNDILSAIDELSDTEPRA